MVVICVKSARLSHYNHVGPINGDPVGPLKVVVVDHRLKVMVQHLFENEEVLVASLVKDAKLAIEPEVDHIGLHEIDHYILESWDS